MNKTQLEELKARICDDYCKFPGEADEDTLYEECENCPLNDLEEDDEG